MGVGEVLLPPIEEPIEFRRAIQEAKAIQDNRMHDNKSNAGPMRTTDDF
jgi:hypothetical protein